MRRTLALVSLVLVVATGCRPTPSQPLPTEPIQPRPVEPSPITITPAAKAALREAANDYQPGHVWWVRLTVKPGGCTGFQSKLDLDLLGVQADDREAVCDGVRILYSAEQDFTVQGAEIDFVSNEKERGFSVKYPNQTEESRRRTQEWVQKSLAALFPPAAEDE